MVRVITYDTSIYKNIFDVMIDLAPTRTCFCIPNKFLVYSLTENTISKFLTNGNNNINNNNNIYNMLDKLIDNSRRILLENNFNIDPHQYYIEFQRYNVHGKTKNNFDWHNDDKGAVLYNVCTLIYYVTKSDTIIGGNLQFKKFGILVKPKIAVMFNGDIAHKPDEMDGEGQRDLIVIMFRRTG